jgi:glycosyltransferase involved in cell wall biosynthesis
MRRLRLHNWYDSNHLKRLRERFLRENVALIYVNSIASAGMLEFLSFVDCPVICHVHELDGAIRAIGVQNLAVLEKRQPLYIAVSRAVKESLVENNAIPSSQIQVIHGFIPIARESAVSSEATRRQLRERIGIPQEAKVVCACGSVDFRKGTDLFLELARRTMQNFDTAPVHFVWVGGTREKIAAMRGQVHDAALKGMVHFVGHTSDPAAYFDASDVFVLTSREDPFPLVVMEAALRSKPIVCFAHAGGAPEFVEADTGFVVPTLDLDSMSDRVVELLSAPNLATRMGRAARQKVMLRHSLDVGGNTIAAAIDDTLRIRRDWSSCESVTSTRQRD